MELNCTLRCERSQFPEGNTIGSHLEKADVEMENRSVVVGVGRRADRKELVGAGTF